MPPYFLEDVPGTACDELVSEPHSEFRCLRRIAGNLVGDESGPIQAGDQASDRQPAALDLGPSGQRELTVSFESGEEGTFGGNQSFGLRCH